VLFDRILKGPPRTLAKFGLIGSIDLEKNKKIKAQ
jgi:hypothetical protein